MTHPTLPAPFADLAPFAAQWARPSENARSEIRWSASKDDFKALYDAMMPRLDDILALLSQHPATGMPEDVHNLFLLACAFAEASPHHELYGGSSAVPYSFDARRFVRTDGDAAL
ncbi:hypothetical protein [Sphingobium chlorophenolicum]|uniref:Uncharacterized protein n=1 Tax=Sphingobium chlorophenolicum TaxID=46429 RepID=A0A081RAA5_SPHCR|nr:hypothetical protein [Sphingobium chlorophenolicum]KEQ52128.1 hypothetical protein BV95_03609 [Sphingobium chlorophenolicum]